MPQAGTLRVQGFQQFLRATNLAGRETKKAVRSTFRQVGDGVKRDWSVREERFGTFTASGFRTVVRQRGISVEQTRRKSAVLTMRRPKFGPKQQAIGNEILAAEGPELMRKLDHALDEVAAIFKR